MKKKLFRIWLIYFLAGAVLFTGVKYLFTFGEDVDFAETVILSVINSLIISLLMIYGSYYSFPRNKFLNKNNSAKPSFPLAGSSIIDVPQGLDFISLKNVIANRWMITFFFVL
jgi:hypothetical protein